ncbi:MULTISPECIES: ADP-ribosylglycohydrolase family protein [Gemella]|uniref:ADP-ribosylglycohydrolase family protein n=1 Tax=Gemella TaxID=1378 RepID=UPI000B0E47EF|nr:MULTISPECIES: ADP-ribosylglycohydrolase family protein [Gemella]
MNNIKDRLKGVLYGFSIVDVMGATTEFMSEAEIKRDYGKLTDIIGGGWLNLKTGGVTDDTQMPICVMEVL